MFLVKVSSITISVTNQLTYLGFQKRSETADIIVSDFCKILTPVVCIFSNLDTEIWTSHNLW